MYDVIFFTTLLHETVSNFLMFPKLYIIMENKLELPVGYEVLPAVVMNVGIFWNLERCTPHVNRRFGGTYHFHLQGRISAE
jgi:hypothetical protein